ncbi:hypothetical protein SCALM49S_07615 [Streptomyces californicus]
MEHRREPEGEDDDPDHLDHRQGPVEPVVGGERGANQETTFGEELWLLWSGDGAHRVHRLDVLPVCPARLRVLATGAVTQCAFFDHHSGPHSFSVTDPLGDLIADRPPGPPGDGDPPDHREPPGDPGPP